MASISSLNSIKGLNLWLDATDLSTIITSATAYDVRQWNDKSSNAYQFIPVRPTDVPKLSTNGISSIAVLFDLASSFQLVSKTKIRATSSVDFFAVLIPYSLWGPRAPLFDSADITVSETDTRFNTQIYADGNEFFRQLNAPGFSRNSSSTGVISGATIFQGNLYVGNNAPVSNFNYLIRYSRQKHTFEFFPPPMYNSYTDALAVYQGKLFTSSSNTWEFYDPAINSFSTSVAITTYTGPLVVYRRNLYSAPASAWENYYYQNSVTPYEGGYLNSLFQFSTGINSFSTVVSMSSNLCNAYWDTNVTTYNSNFMVYKDTLYVNSYNNTYGGQMFRYNGTFFNNAHNLGGGYGYTSMYWGSLIIASNSQMLYKFNDTGTYQNFGRSLYGMVGGEGVYSGYNGISGNAVTYKGNFWFQRNGSTSNNNTTTIQIFQGENGGEYSNSYTNPYVSAESGVAPNSSNLMIVHDGKIYFCGNTFNYIYEYGNGTSVDQSFSTLTSAAIILQIRKSPTVCQMYLNGSLVESQPVDFTYNDQVAREMWIGGSAGVMTSGQSDCGSDHFQGAIQGIVQYNTILSTSERQKVEGILAWTFNIQNILPASHPYRNSSP